MPAATPPGRDPRVDAYIASAAAFARPVLTHLRELVHQACPAVTETIKWGMPSFEYRGILCGMAAFKQHCVFGFWKHELVFRGPAAVDSSARGKAPAGSARRKLVNGDADRPATRLAPKDDAMGELGRITSVKDLPSKATILRLVRRAVELNEQGIKSPRVVKPKTKLVVPRDLAAALRNHPAAASTFNEFSYSKRKDYIEWLNEAKTKATRDRRLATTLEWLAQGKSRNWKYERC